MIIKNFKKFNKLNEYKELSDIRNEYPVDLKITYQTSDVPAIYLSSIVIHDEYRNQGIGTKVMNDLIKWADHYNAVITLTPENTWGSNVTRLKKFYKKFGFVMNKGRNKDYRFIGSMIRYPK